MANTTADGSAYTDDQRRWSYSSLVPGYGGSSELPFMGMEKDAYSDMSDNPLCQTLMQANCDPGPAHSSPPSQQLQSHQLEPDQDRQEGPSRGNRGGKEDRHQAIALKQWRCSVHDLCFGTKSDLTRHHKEVHRTDLYGNPVAPFECPVSWCVRRFMRRGNLLTHMQKLHPNLSDAACIREVANAGTNSAPATETIEPHVEPPHPPIGDALDSSMALNDTENTDEKHAADRLHAKHQRFLWHKRYLKITKLEYEAFQAKQEELELYVNAVKQWLDNQSNPERFARDRRIYDRARNQLAENALRLRALEVELEGEESRHFESADGDQSSDILHSCELATSDGM